MACVCFDLIVFVYFCSVFLVVFPCWVQDFLVCFGCFMHSCFAVLLRLILIMFVFFDFVWVF